MERTSGDGWLGPRFARWLPLATATSLVLLSLLTVSLHGETHVDDAFISYRYAWNLAQGHDLVFNPGEPVLGTTAPGFCLLLALCSLVGLGIPAAATFLGAMGVAISALVVGLLLRRDGPLAALCGGTAVALNALFIAYANSGMESTLYACFTITGIYLLHVKPAPRLAGLLIGFACLIRPEGVVVMLLHGLHLAWQRRWACLIRVATFAALLLLPWVVAALWFYGGLLPQSVTAKLTMASALPGLQITLEYGLLGLWLSHKGAGSWLHVAWPVAVGLVLAGTLLRLRRAPEAHVISAAAILAIHLAGYLYAALTGVSNRMWYMAQIVPLWAVVACAAIFGLSRRPWLRRGLLLFTALASFGFSTVSRGKLLPPGGVPFMSRRADLLLSVGKALKPHVRPGQRIAAPEIGALGWALPDVPILDTAGLVSREVVVYWARRPLPGAHDGAIHPDAIKDLRPAWLVSVPAFMRFLVREPWFFEAYKGAGSVGSKRFGPHLRADIFSRR